MYVQCTCTCICLHAECVKVGLYDYFRNKKYDTNMYSIRQKKLSRPYRLNAVETVARVPCFCVKGPFNLNGRNGRTTAGVDLHRTRDWSAHTVVSN